jgi:hypothetical protein
MKGFPKHINSKKDLFKLKPLYPEKIKKWMQDQLDNREGWYIVKQVESKDAVKTSETVRAREVKTDDITETYEEQYGPIPGNAIDRFGLTDEDIAKLVDG